MNKKLFESAMKRYGDTQESLANFLGLTRACVNRKINESTASFTQPEIKSIKERYELTAEEIDEIFFAENVS